MTTYRDIEILLSEADDYVRTMLQGFEEQLQGDRINYRKGEDWDKDTLPEAETLSPPSQMPSRPPNRR